jgi:hypothetical protein
MKTLTDSERRTLRLGAIALGIYLVAFFGLKWFRAAETVRKDYARLRGTAATLRAEAERYQIRADRLERLMTRLQIEPATIQTNTVVGQASSALQKAAQAQGLQVTSIRESQSRASERELGSIQIEAAGPPPAVLGLLARLNTLGVPALVESVRFGSNPRGPGMVKFTLIIVILDFEQWKPREASRA